jgi:hypothetical protein
MRTTSMIARMTVIGLVMSMSLWAMLMGNPDQAQANLVAPDDTSRVERHSDLPRQFLGVQLGMGRVEVARNAHNGPSKVDKGDVIVMSRRDRYIKRVEYGFYNGALYRVQAFYRPERLIGGADTLVLRLKDAYGQPLVDREETIAPASDVLTETRTVWNDGRTEIALVERERGSELGRDIALIMTDVQLAQMKEDASREELRQRIQDVPIPLPDYHTSNRTAATRSDAHERHAALPYDAPPLNRSRASNIG